ncbi:GyrI-like domain-containing protein [Mollicutes bacterium LVI A0039]|nr:GyrI-like domain-containing protein [Mollicutes bacterium LVI A0039]
MKKHYKEYYRAIKKPQILELPQIPIISIKGQGNPNDNPQFEAHISCLYQLSYSFRMSYKNEPIPGYQSYTVGPLEGFWSTIDNQMYDQDKDKLSYEIFIIQPDFITEDVFLTHQAKMILKNPQIQDVVFKYANEGLVGQILHVGPFETESESIAILEQYLDEQGYEIVPDTHHEIYLSDFRKVTSDKYKTLIRYKIKKV